MAGTNGGTGGVRALFALIGLGVGAYGGWQAYDWTESIWLAVFVGLMAMTYISRGLADVITDPQKGRRFAFFTLPVIFAVGGLAGAYALWDRWWLAVVIGFVLYGIGSMVANAAFPRIAVEEAADSMSRMGVEEQPAQPDEDVNVLPSLPSPYDKMK
jgi:hypothetical protein